MAQQLPKRCRLDTADRQFSLRLQGIYLTNLYRLNCTGTRYTYLQLVLTVKEE